MSRFKATDSPRERVDITETLTDGDQLVDIACSDDSPRVRLVAVTRIEDDQKLLEVVQRAPELDVRLVAVERISSEQLIADILKDPKNIELLGMCFSRITDRTIIESIAQDPKISSIARRLAVEHYADESYLADALEAKSNRKSPEAVEALVNYHGGGLKGVRAIGRFKRSEKALMALGTIAQGGGESGCLAVEYLCKALASPNPKLATIAADELAAIADPQLVETIVCALDDPKLEAPIRKVLDRIGTAEARSALGTGA